MIRLEPDTSTGQEKTRIGSVWCSVTWTFVDTVLLIAVLKVFVLLRGKQENQVADLFRYRIVQGRLLLKVTFVQVLN